jgi:hypothetical protein
MAARSGAAPLFNTTLEMASEEEEDPEERVLYSSEYTPLSSSIPVPPTGTSTDMANVVPPTAVAETTDGHRRDWIFRVRRGRSLPGTMADYHPASPSQGFDLNTPAFIDSSIEVVEVISEDPSTTVSMAAAPFIQITDSSSSTAGSTVATPTAPLGRTLRRFATAAANHRPSLRPGSWALAASDLPSGGF